MRSDRREFLMLALSSAAPLLSREQPPHDLAAITIGQAAELIRKKAVSPVELTRTCLDRIERMNPALNAYITVMAGQAMAQARELENEQHRGRLRGKLHGIPIGLKDLLDTRGVRTTAASAVFADRVPTADAEVVRRL